MHVVIIMAALLIRILNQIKIIVVLAGIFAPKVQMILKKHVAIAPVSMKAPIQIIATAVVIIPVAQTFVLPSPSMVVKFKNHAVTVNVLISFLLMFLIAAVVIYIVPLITVLGASVVAALLV